MQVVRLDPRRRDVHTLAEAVAGALARPAAHPLALAPTAVGGCRADCPAGLHRPARPPPSTTSAASLDPDEDLARAEAVFAWVTDTTALVTTRTHEQRRTWSDRFDRWATAPVLGPVIFLVVMWAVFPLTTTVAAPLQDALDSFFSGPVTTVPTAAFAAVGLGATS